MGGCSIIPGGTHGSTHGWQAAQKTRIQGNYLLLLFCFYYVYMLLLLLVLSSVSPIRIYKQHGCFFYFANIHIVAHSQALF